MCFEQHKPRQPRSWLIFNVRPTNISIRDEIVKLIESERTKLLAKEASAILQDAMLEKRFASIKEMINQAVLAAPEYTRVSFWSRGADVRVGSYSGSVDKEKVHWDISLNSEDIFRITLRVNRTYAYGGFMPTDYHKSKIEFITELEFCTHFAEDYAKEIAALLHRKLNPGLTRR